MRISTFNLARCKPGTSNRAESLRRIMSEIDADVFVLTETFLEFTPGNGYELIAYTSAAPDRTPEERWTCIWSRIGGESIPTSSDPERMTAAIVPFATTAGLCIVGTVLPWLADKRHPTLSGSDAFCHALHNQAAEWQAISTKTYSPQVIIMDRAAVGLNSAPPTRTRTWSRMHRSYLCE